MSQTRADQIRQYDRIAKLFDQRLGLYARAAIEEAVSLAKLDGTEAVLDACSGTGELLQRIALTEHRGTLVGLDFSQTMLNAAAARLRRYPNISFKYAAIEKLALPNDYFHIVFNTNAFHYLDNPVAALREFRRVLRPQGRLILADLAANSSLTRLWSRLRRLFRPTYSHLYRVEELAGLLRANGYTILRKKISRVNLFWSVMLFEAQKTSIQEPKK